MAYTPPQKDIIIIVGGEGDKSGRSESNGGGCTKAAFDAENGDWSKFMAPNGFPVVSLADSFVTMTNNGSGKVRVTKTGAGFYDVVVGTLARIWDCATNYADYNAKRVEVIAVDTVSGNWCDLELTYVGDEADISIKVGGALDRLLTAVENITISDAAFNRTIYTNLAESDYSRIEFNYGGSKQSNTWLSIVGCGSGGAVLTKGNYVTLSRQNERGTWFDLNNKTNITIANIKFTNVGIDGSAINGYGSPAADKLVVLKNCWFGGTNSGDYSIALYYYHGFIIDCVFEDFDGTYEIFLDGYSVSASIQNCVFDGNGHPAINVNDGSAFIEGNVIHDADKGILIDGSGTVFVVRNSFYNITDSCISLESTTAALNEHSNIFHVADAADDYAISITNGSIMYSGYSCTNATTNGLLNESNLGVNFIGGSLNSTDPQFVNAGGGDFRLKPGSSCLNTGKLTAGGGYSSMGAWQRSQKIACQLIR